MRPLIEKLPLSQDSSFVARTHRTPHFEVPWHQHIELELILFTEGEGVSFVGNYVGEFKTGDIFFLGSNLPHTFQKAKKEMITSAVVVHFRENFWGSDFLQLPESNAIRDLFETAKQGLRIVGNSRELMNPLIKALESARGFAKITKLCESLEIISRNQEFIAVSTQEVKELNSKDKERIDSIFQYTIENFHEPIALENVAGLVCMSVPAFCSYFKKRTRKTYIDFLNEVRIGYACKQLINTNKSIRDICYESGFNTLANFNKQFLKIRHITPLKYRNTFLSGAVNAI